jgi:hypothetical protein
VYSLAADILTDLPAGTITELEIYFQLFKIRVICHFWIGCNVVGKIYVNRPIFLLASENSKRKMTDEIQLILMYHTQARLY